MSATPESAPLAPGTLPEIPSPPRRGAVSALQKRLLNLGAAESGELGLSEEAAEAIAFAVADPTETRNYALSHLSYMRVPGGTLTLFRDRLLVNRVITYPVNPRVLDTQHFPAAGSGGDSSRLFWPEGDVAADPDDHCELLLRGGTRSRVSGVLQDHAKRLRQQNKLDTIPELGVLRPIIVMAMEVRTDDDGKDPVVVLTSVEGSSRTAWSHFAQGLDAADPLYGATADPAAAQAVARSLSHIATAPADTVTPKELQRARTLFIPAEIIVGFTPDAGAGRTSIAAVADQLLGLTHIDPPKPWSPQAAEAKIGEKVLASLHERGYITTDEHAWLAGMLTPEEALDKGLDPWLARRAAQLLWLASRAPDDPISQAVAEGVRNASFQRRVVRQAKGDSMAALALRAFDPGSARDERKVRAALPRAMRTPAFYVTGKSGNGKWTVTARSPDELRDAALKELEDGKTGGATLELGALAVWGLVTSGRLARGSAKNREGGDPRDPEQIIGSLMSSEVGIRVLHRVVADDYAGTAPRRIDLAAFSPVPTADGNWAPVTEDWLRNEVVPRPDAQSTPAAAQDTAATMTPLKRLEQRLEAVDGHVARIPILFSELDEIEDDDGTSVIAREGIDDGRAQRWTQVFVSAITTVGNRAAAHNSRYGSIAERDDDDSDVDTDGETSGT
jgi:hypothetical protein